MRRVKITGYVIYDESELPYGTDGKAVAGIIGDRLFNEEFPREWEFRAEEDEDIEWEREE